MIRSITDICTINGRSAVAGDGVAGCAINGFVSPMWDPINGVCSMPPKVPANIMPFVHLAGLVVDCNPCLLRYATESTKTAAAEVAVSRQGG